MEKSEWEKSKEIHEREIRELSDFFDAQVEIFLRTHDFEKITFDNDFLVICRVYYQEVVKDPQEYKIFTDYIDFECSQPVLFEDSEKLYLNSLKKFGEKIYVMEELLNFYMANFDYEKVSILYERFKLQFGRSKYIEEFLANPLFE